MRVLFVTGEFPPMQGGVGDCTNEIAQELAKLGVEAHVLTSTSRESSAEHGYGGGARPVEEYGVHVRRAIGRWGWGTIPLLGRIVRELEPAIVHIQYQTGAYGMRPAINLSPWAMTRRRDAPQVVTTFHDLKVPYLFPKARRLRESVTKFLARTSDAVISTNDEDYRRLSTWGLRELSLIPIGSNIPTTPPAGYDRAAWRARLGVDQDSLLLSYFGFLNESKGGETLIRALAFLPNAKLIMVGGQVGASDPTNRAYLASIKKLIGESGLASRVIWTDFVPADEVSANLIASDICVLPYRDGASFRRGSFLAALAHGLPVVTTRGTEEQNPEGILPALRDEVNVLLLPPDDASAIGRAVDRLSQQPQLRTKLSDGAQALATFFTWDRIARRHLELYERLLVVNS